MLITKIIHVEHNWYNSEYVTSASYFHTTDGRVPASHRVLVHACYAVLAVIFRWSYICTGGHSLPVHIQTMNYTVLKVAPLYHAAVICLLYTFKDVSDTQQSMSKSSFNNM